MDVAAFDTEQFLTVGDAARLLDLSTSRVRQLAEQGHLRAARTAGGLRLFRRPDVEALLWRRREQQPMTGGDKDQEG